MKNDKWVRFTIGLCIFIIAFVALPKLHHFIPGSDHMRQVIETEKIDAAAIFYSSESRSSGARKAIEEKMELGKKEAKKL